MVSTSKEISNYNFEEIGEIVKITDNYSLIINSNN